MRRAPDAEELKHLDLVERTRLRAKVKAEVQRRGLASVMNQTRWEELRAAMLGLPFKPVFQLQTVAGPREPLWSSDQVTSQGCWCAECIEPFWAIEWIRILPCLWREEGALVPLKGAKNQALLAMLALSDGSSMPSDRATRTPRAAGRAGAPEEGADKTALAAP